MYGSLRQSEGIDCGADDGGDLILSGILTTQFDDVRTPYEALGFQLEETSTIDKWTSAWFRAPAVSPPQS